MFVAVSIALIVVLAALAASYALCPPGRVWTLVRGGVSAALTVGGLVADVVTRCRFGSLEAHNEWARDAFTQYSQPLVFTAIVAVFILAASVLTAKRKTKTVVCLSAAAAFALLAFGYTALFSEMTSGGALEVDHYIRILGCAIAACFGAVDLAAEGKQLVLDARSAKKGRKKTPRPAKAGAAEGASSRRSASKDRKR